MLETMMYSVKRRSADIGVSFTGGRRHVHTSSGGVSTFSLCKVTFYLKHKCMVIKKNVVNASNVHVVLREAFLIFKFITKNVQKCSTCPEFQFYFVCQD